MDHEIDVVSELEPDDLKQIARVVGSDRKDLRRVGVGFEIDDGDGMVEGVEDGGIRYAVPARRPMDLHIHNIVIRNSQEWKGSVIAWHSQTVISASASQSEKCRPRSVSNMGVLGRLPVDLCGPISGIETSPWVADF